MMYNPRAVLWHLTISNVLTAAMGNIVSVDVTIPKNERQLRVNSASTQRQQSFNAVRCCTMYNPRAVLQHLHIIEVLSTVNGTMVNLDVAIPQYEHHQHVNWASTEY
jgi:hypothetical protein